MFQRSCFFLTLVLLVVLQAACSSNGKQWNPDDYTVKSGDTVYSIAWRYELDPEEFVAWNNLGSSKLIKPGQRLHTRKPHNFVSSSKADRSYSGKIAYAPQTSTHKKTSATANQKWLKVRKGDTLYGISRSYGVSVEQLVKLNQLKKPYMLQPGQTVFLKPLKTTASSKSQKSKSSTRRTPSGSSTGKGQRSKSQAESWPKTVRWQRPAKGKVVKKFNRQRNDAKGIDIAGRQGDSIVAAAKGKVVYSGDGLISYGKLIIIKHNNTHLSAYAYNHKLLVKEGDIVKTGQKIAEMGRKDKLSPRLHFEIRKNGKPVDPLKYLPW
jgi:lipoprotein NlpD